MRATARQEKQHGIWWEAEAECPFFRRVRREQREIVCESISAEATVSALRFSAEGPLLDYLRGLCCDLRRYGDCPVYQAILQKYEAGD